MQLTRTYRQSSGLRLHKQLLSPLIYLLINCSLILLVGYFAGRILKNTMTISCQQMFRLANSEKSQDILFNFKRENRQLIIRVGGVINSLMIN